MLNAANVHRIKPCLKTVPRYRAQIVHILFVAVNPFFLLLLPSMAVPGICRYIRVTLHQTVLHGDDKNQASNTQEPTPRPMYCTLNSVLQG